MIRISVLLSAFAFLVACGVDGEPLTPEYTTSTTIGYNSKTGSFTKTSIGIDLTGGL